MSNASVHPQTSILGFVNPNTWPIVINISSVNVNMTIQPKSYVTLRDGRRVNDPLLEQFVGPGMLVKEKSKSAVPLIPFPRPAPLGTVTTNGISASHKVNKDSRGIVQDSSFQGIDMPPPADGSQSSIHAYTKEDAIRLGIIKPMIERHVNAPKATAGVESHKTLPSIDDDMPRDAKPSEAKKIIAQLKAGQSLPAPVEDETPEVEEPGLSKKEEETLTTKLLESLSPGSLEPKKNTSNPFVCKADGKSFPKKSRLLAYVKKNFPEREVELMAEYA
jgi:hypothetical protein